MTLPDSSGAPVVELFYELEIDERLGRAHRRTAADALAHQIEQVIVVLAHDLDEQVEAARRDDDIGDFWHLGDLAGDCFDVAFTPDADHRLTGEADLQRVGDRDDLHHATVEQALHALPDGGLREPDRLADSRVRSPTVFLQL